MPIWEQYEVEVETKVTVLVGGRAVSQFTTFGTAKGGSNENVKEAGIPAATLKALQQASKAAIEHANATRRTRRQEIGYRDGN